MAKKKPQIIAIIFFISVNIDNYHNKCPIFITFVFFGDKAKKKITLIITIIFFISADIDNYHDKCQIFISFKFFWLYGQKNPHKLLQ